MSSQVQSKRTTAVNPDIKIEKSGKVNLAYQRDKDRELVKGIFRFHECPGGEMSFVFKAYKGDKIEKYTVVDGQVHSVPLGVAKHLNNNGWYPVHGFKQNEQGGPHVTIGRKVKRFSFQSLEFVDLDDQPLIVAPGLI